MDAARAFLQAGGIERILLLCMPASQPPPDTQPSEVRLARGSIYGTRDAGRSSYVHFKSKEQKDFNIWESALEKGLNPFCPDGHCTLVACSHVDNLFIAFDRRCKSTLAVMEALVKEFMMTRKEKDFVFCGRRVQVEPGQMIVSQQQAAVAGNA